MSLSMKCTLKISLSLSILALFVSHLQLAADVEAAKKVFLCQVRLIKIEVNTVQSKLDKREVKYVCRVQEV